MAASRVESVCALLDQAQSGRAELWEMLLKHVESGIARRQEAADTDTSD
jgi:hypothetical protein